MASPQKEHGFTPIANELLRALIRQAIPGRRMRIWLALAIDSYGRSRKETTLSIGEIAAMTNIDKRSVVRELQALVVARMTLPPGSGNPATGNKIMRKIEKDYDRWVVAGTPHSGRDATTSSGNGATTPLPLTTVRARGIRGVNVFKKEKILLRRKREIFVPPTPEQATAYALSQGFTLDGNDFVNHYATTGWTRKGAKITNWKACVMTWKKNAISKGKTNGLDFN